MRHSIWDQLPYDRSKLKFSFCEGPLVAKSSMFCLSENVFFCLPRPAPSKDIVAEYILLGQHCRWNVASAWPRRVHWSIICTSEPVSPSGSKISTLALSVFGHGLLGVVGTGLITVRYLSQAVPWKTLQAEVSKASSQSSWGTSSNTELVKEIPEDLSSATTASAVVHLLHHPNPLIS